MKEDIERDEDVLAEEKRVKQTPNDEFRIKVDSLRKVYWLGSGISCCCGKRRSKFARKQADTTRGALVAVEKLSFGLQSGECFALLGVNGAGKSTTFKSLTCEVEPTAGQIHIESIDVNKQFNKIRKLIGYCPQTNPIFDDLSVEEHIEYFGRIKGIPSKIRPKLVNQAIT